MSADAPNNFPQSARFGFRRVLGSGGFGVVFEADDCKRNTRVALKTLQQIDPTALYSFKREFRSLCDVSHPNLVALHELISEGDRLFFTMDLVEGTDFLHHVRTDPSIAAASTVLAPLNETPRDDSTRPQTSAKEALAPDAALQRDSASPKTDDPARWARLRAALRQLAQGLLALHSRGKLHRDLKPSNVMVNREGKVVILDFGLVAEMSHGQAHPSVGSAAGTPAYMAPEQAVGEPASPANDWYSVGVMLYEALTGRLPFEGTPIQILLQKQRSEPVPPDTIEPFAPSDLADLCMRLVRRAPSERAVGADVLSVSTWTSRPPDDNPPPDPMSAETPLFLGRERQLSVLRETFHRAQNGKGTLVHVRGASGMGKSALVQHFLDDLARTTDAVLLQGRCYERESVPYKAVDSLIDAISRHLTKLLPARAAELMPRDIHALVRLFPVLDRVKAVAEAPRRGPLPPDAQELRRRGFAALRELLGRIGDRRPLVVSIDDLQWGDADSALLLGEVLREPDPPVFLLLIGYRSEDAEKSEMLRSLPAWMTVPKDDTAASEGSSSVRDAEPAGDSAVRSLRVDALSPEEARAVALRVLGDRGSTQRAEEIAEQAAGSPFFVHELAREVRSRDPESTDQIRLETVLANRLSRLRVDARSLLECVAVAGRPLRRSIAREAAGLDAEAEHAAMGTLRAERLLRSRGAAEEEELETFHDRIREATLAQLGATDLAKRHLGLGSVLEASGKAGPDVLALHFRRAERHDKACPYAAQAGDRAAEALAFDRAAALFAYALEVAPEDAERRRDLRIRLGDAHKNAGRGGEAVAEYTTAMAGAPEGLRFDLQRRAAEQLLWSGRLEEGRRMLAAVLASVGVPFHRNRWLVLLSFLFWRLLLRTRSLGFPKGPPRPTSPALEARLSACKTAAVGLMLSDAPRATNYAARYLWIALWTRDPRHLAMGLSYEAAATALTGRAGLERARRIAEAASNAAETVGDPYLLALQKFMLAAAEAYNGQWAVGLRLARAAEKIWLEQCSGVHGELVAARVWVIWTLFQLGDIQAYRAAVAPLRQGAEKRGDRTALGFAGGMDFLVHLADDRPEPALKSMVRTGMEWPGEFNNFAFLETISYARFTLYTGTPEASRDLFASRHRSLTRTLLLQQQMYRVMFYDLRASLSLAVAAKLAREDPSAREMVMEASRDSSRLAREKTDWARALSTLRDATIASARGDAESALRLLDSAIPQLEACELGLYAASARRRKGELLGGPEGEALVVAVDAWMAERTIKNPARMAELFAPGFRRARST